MLLLLQQFPQELSPWNFLHLRLGHLGYDNVKVMATSGLVTGTQTDSGNFDRECNGCAMGKQSRDTLAKKSMEEIASGILDLVNADV